MRTTLLGLLLIASVFFVPNFGAETQAGTVPQINNIKAFSPFFDLGQGAVRIIAIVSPDCDACAQTVDVIVDLFSAVSNNRLRAYLIVAPDPPSESALAALRLFAKVTDRRVSCFWDPTGVARAHWNSATGSESTAWDALFVYDTDAGSGAMGETQAYWVYDHQSSEFASPDAEALEAQVRELLENFEERTRAEDTSPENP
ncbi:MAG: hypothetical protein IH969_02115 [Candidatus Krumholzibacteriota bacterium]|nr:hypothetical protein [Candidatus Krumholzibacteriota bacterium]